MEAFTSVSASSLVQREGGSEEPEMAKVLKKDFGYEKNGTYLIRNKSGREVEILGKHVVRAVKVEGGTLLGLVCHGPEYKDEKRINAAEEARMKEGLPDPESLPMVAGEEKAEPKPAEEPFQTDFDKELEEALDGGEVDLPLPKPPVRKDGKVACTYVSPEGDRCKGIAVKGTDRCRHHPKKTKKAAKPKPKRRRIDIDDVLAVPKKRRRKK